MNVFLTILYSIECVNINRWLEFNHDDPLQIELNVYSVN